MLGIGGETPRRRRVRVRAAREPETGRGWFIVLCNAALGGVLVSAVLLGAASRPQTLDDGPALLPGPAGEAARAARVDQLTARHDCWSGAIPSGVTPGGVIVSLRGESPFFSEPLVAEAIEYRRNPAGPPKPGDLVARDELEVFAFCP